MVLPLENLLLYLGYFATMTNDSRQIDAKHSSIPILDLSWAENPDKRPHLLKELHSAFFDIGFLYIKNHGVPQSTISSLTDLLPPLFNLSEAERAALSKKNSPHFLGYSGFAEETTLGKQDLREQFDYATELPVVWRDPNTISTNALTTNGHDTNGTSKEERNFTPLYWRLRGPNQWPSESSLPGFRQALTAYHNAVSGLSYRFVHLIEEAFEIPIGTFDHFFGHQDPHTTLPNSHEETTRSFLPPQHRIKLLKYPPSPPQPPSDSSSQGVGPHKDSSGWLTFLYQVGTEPGLEVLSANDRDWIPAPPIEGTFVVNFGNALEAATEGAVKATTHRVLSPQGNVRYSIPFFMGLPLDMTVSEVRGWIPEEVRRMRRDADGAGGQGKGEAVDGFLDPRWDSLGESQLRKWIRSHRDVGERWYGREVVEYYTT